MRKIVILISIALLCNLPIASASNIEVSVLSKGPYSVGDVITLKFTLITKNKIGDVNVNLIRKTSLGLAPKTFQSLNFIGDYDNWQGFPFDNARIKVGTKKLTFDNNYFLHSESKDLNGNFVTTIVRSKIISNGYSEKNIVLDTIEISFIDELRQSYEYSPYIEPQLILGERVVPIGSAINRKTDSMPAPIMTIEEASTNVIDLPKFTAAKTPIFYSIVESQPENNCQLSGFRFPGDSASNLKFNSAGVCKVIAGTAQDDTFFENKVYYTLEMTKNAQPLKGNFESVNRYLLNVKNSSLQILDDYNLDYYKSIRRSEDRMEVVKKINEIKSLIQNRIKLPTDGIPNLETFSIDDIKLIKAEAGEVYVSILQATLDRLAQYSSYEQSIKARPTITCVKGKLTKKVTATNPKCPAGYKKK